MEPELHEVFLEAVLRLAAKDPDLAADLVSEHPDTVVKILLSVGQICRVFTRLSLDMTDNPPEVVPGSDIQRNRVLSMTALTKIIELMTPHVSKQDRKLLEDVVALLETLAFNRPNIKVN